MGAARVLQDGDGFSICRASVSKPGITIADTLFTNGARVVAEPPSPRALRTLRQIIARAPPHMQPAALASKPLPTEADGTACAVDLRDGPAGGCRAHYTLLEPGAYLVRVALTLPCVATSEEGAFITAAPRTASTAAAALAVGVLVVKVKVCVHECL